MAVQYGHSNDGAAALRRGAQLFLCFKSLQLLGIPALGKMAEKVSWWESNPLPLARKQCALSIGPSCHAGSIHSLTHETNKNGK